MVKIHPDILIKEYSEEPKQKLKKLNFKQIQEPETKPFKLTNGPIF